MLRQYEISVWDDVLNESKTEYIEKCLAIIGSDSMTTDCRANKPQFVRRSNGEFELTFELYNHYFDKQELDFIENPFIKLLINERKIKLHLIDKDEWYDLIIKNIQENSEQKSFIYTAKALFINELSKNGLELVYDPELENSIGTIQELGGRAVEGTDWIISDESELIQQTNIEPLYKIILNKNIKAQNMFAEENIDIPDHSLIYAFYSDITKESSYLQFLYREDGNYTFDTDTQAVNNSKNWFITDVIYQDGIPDIALILPELEDLTGNNRLEIAMEFQGKKYIRSVMTEYEPLLDKLVTIHNDENNEPNIRSYINYEYLSPTMVGTLITNPNNFTDNIGWSKEGTESFLPGFYPPIDNLEGSELISAMNKAELALQVYLNEGEHIHNSGLLDNRKDFVPDGIAEKEQYVIRLNYDAVKRVINNDIITDTKIENAFLDCFIAFYEGYQEDGTYKFVTLENGDIDKIFEFSHQDAQIIDNYVVITASAKKAVTYQQMLVKKLGVFFKASKTATYIIKNVDLFKYYEHNGKIVFPEDIPNGDDLIKTIYHYYNKNSLEGLSSSDEIQYIYKGQLEQTQYLPVYDEKCTKRRSLKISKSNRFNIIQELCELFECWADFKIDHKTNGEIIPGTKRIIFKNFLGKENFAGFKYGINSRSIQRTLDSEQIVTKILVEENNNEFATDGFCTIARAVDNPTGELFFYDFRHYYGQGLLQYSELMNDLYLYDVNLPWLGYYKRLKEKNKKRLSMVDELEALARNLSDLEASSQTYYLIHTEASEQENLLKQELASYPVTKGYKYEDFISETPSAGVEKILKNDPEAVRIITGITVAKKQHETYEKMYITYNTAYTEAKTRYEELEDLLEQLKEEKEEINKEFYTKYSRFIQEGSWSSEDYTDDNLYYYDAMATLAASANPKVSYTINVIDVSSQEGFEGYTFDVGDKTTIEDTEFFGWTLVDGVRTPIQEEIIVSEILLMLDSPAEDIIKVQNYKTNFEDMFQRINTTTTALQYQSGSFARAAAVVTSTGEIKAETLQQSFDRNAFVLSNASDQTVTWDESGITVTSPKNANHIVRIVNGGVYLTKDSGTTWSAAITGSGINASYINAGQIDTNLIRIMNGVWPTYRWDSNGLSAYHYTLDDNGSIISINYDNYVRFDQYGIYGVHKDERWIAENLESVKNNADFALTWDGFILRKNHGAGYLELSSDNDFIISDGTHQRIKIGNIGTKEEPIYGITIKDGSGAAVIETIDDGSLWLKDQLNISTSQNNTHVQIGYLDGYKTEEGTNIYQVINATDKFIVYEDGSIYGENAYLKDGYFEGEIQATSGSFKGHIEATSGSIGGVEIANIEQTLENTKGIEIITSPSNIIKMIDGEATPEQINLSLSLIGYIHTDNSSYNWQYSSNFESWTSFSNTPEAVFIYNENYFLNDKVYIKCDFQVDANSKTESAFIPIIILRDGTNGQDGKDGQAGANGEDAYSVAIISSAGTIFKNNNGETTLQCIVYKGSSEYKDIKSYQWFKNDIILTGQTGNSLIVTADDVDSTALYSCEVEI